MGAKFDSETIAMTKGQNVMDALREALKKKGFAAMMEDEIFIIDNVTVKSVDGNEVVCEVEYEYGR